jgi:hypothetical protein
MSRSAPPLAGRRGSSYIFEAMYSVVAHNADPYLELDIPPPFRVILRLWSTQFGQRLFFAAPRARQPDLQFRVPTGRSSGPSGHFARTWFAYLWGCCRDDH